jgi:hypothetical protein
MRFRVTIQEGTTTHRVVVSRARSHEEAYVQAIEVLHLEYGVEASVAIL